MRELQLDDLFGSSKPVVTKDSCATETVRYTLRDMGFPSFN